MLLMSFQSTHCREKKGEKKADIHQVEKKKIAAVSSFLQSAALD